MADFLVSVVTSAAVGATLASVVIWLFKSWISERLKNAIKHEYDQKLETHKAELKAQSDTESERLRSHLSIVAIEHEVKFSGLHNKRAEVITDLYSFLVQAYWDASSFASPAEWAGEPDKKQKYVIAMNSLADFFRFFDKNRIYLPESICSPLEGFVREMRSNAMGFGVYVRYGDANLPQHALDKKYEAWDKAWKYFEKEVPDARFALERELRRLLGGSEVEVTPVRRD